jgi:hypothetical protein
VASLRATRTKDFDSLKVGGLLERMGQGLYLCEPPTGYPDTAPAWLSTGALLDRMNFGVQLFAPAHPFTGAEPAIPASLQACRQPQACLDGLGRWLVKDGLSDSTRAVLTEKMGDPALFTGPKHAFQIGKLAALMLGSPDFQRK